LHLCERIAGLRSPGKGANRTILDCLICAWGAEKRSFCRRGARGRRQPPGGFGRSSFGRSLGRFHRLQLGKGLGSWRQRLRRIIRHAV